MSKKWSIDDAPTLTGKVAVVTGANSGLGFETTKALRRKGALVIMACRNEAKAQTAIEELEATGLGPTPEFVELDLEDDESVHRAATAILADHPSIDLLINNAGVMGLSGDDGPARQMKANFLGHVAFTLDLMPGLESAGGRIVMLSSNMHRRGKLTKENPLDISGQSRMTAYGSTKLADLVFSFEADRRLRAQRSNVSIRAAHPGWSRSELAAKGPVDGRGNLSKKLGSFAGAHFGQKTAQGALPTLRAALDPSIPPGSYVGPDGIFELWGDPTTVDASKAATDAELGAALFDAALGAVGAKWPEGSADA
jgi:NAD(P)-dependent dehydrogenase (short-subunit alcohol dehydrogenase family)